MNKVTIGIAIPCYKGHIEALQFLLDSIERQTRKADNVIVSCSSCEASDIPPSYYKYSFPLQIVTHTEIRNAAQNRNTAISYLNTDLVTVMDADDQMHPQRLESIEHCFQNPNTEVFVHFYETRVHHDFVNYTAFPLELNKLYVCPWRSVQHINYPRGDIVHNGQVSFRRKTFEKVRYREEQYYFGREDIFFVGDIIRLYPNGTAFCPLRLSKYIPSRTQIKDPSR
uniref:Glycosyltransferase 2-like domain-containing protein n=1 Tax=viral metagenome TaxID=1070528 RepID=A0A6C0KR75_9ZZZZ